MKFIDKGKRVQVQIGENHPTFGFYLLADFNIHKEHFEEFLNHVIEECRKAYKQDELFPGIEKNGTLENPWSNW